MVMIYDHLVIYHDSTSKINNNFALEAFLSFADISIYLTFKLSSWKIGCTRSFELKTWTKYFRQTLVFI